MRGGVVALPTHLGKGGGGRGDNRRPPEAVDVLLRSLRANHPDSARLENPRDLHACLGHVLEVLGLAVVGTLEVVEHLRRHGRIERPVLEPVWRDWV